jgi:lipoic acid synthetase
LGRKPPWIKVRLPTGERQARFARIKARARALNLNTVCEEARCPNIGECWGGGTATFMVMGDICTRGCRFCAVNTRRSGAPLDPMEPANLARSIQEMDLDYVVVTSVNRDDLALQGADHFAACIRAIQLASPKTRVEVLIPDFQAKTELLELIVQAGPTVIAHNIETVERLTPTVRDPRAGYSQSLRVLAWLKQRRPGHHTKSSIMVGCGETTAEVTQCMRDLRSVGVSFLTLGQYLQPTARHLKVHAYVEPAQFSDWETEAKGLGFHVVASGPLVRSSYKAGEYFIRQFLAQKPSPERELSP